MTTTPMTTSPATATADRSPRPGGEVAWSPPFGALARQRLTLELRAFRRVREEVVFTFALPIMLLGLFAVIFGGEIGNTGVDLSQYYVAGMLASTGLIVGFQSLTGQLALEQHDGTLKRLAGTPMPKAAYMAGKVGMVCVVAAIQTATLFTIGVAAFGVTLPDAQGWALLVSVLVLNLAIWTLLGIAFSRLIRNPRAGGAVAVPPALILQFISGVYIPFDNIPPWLQTVASVFPLRWATLGMRRAVLPDSFASLEPGGSWQTPAMYLVLLAWLVAGAVLAGILFRWRVRE
jgi:ABC-2 type transport system permease protein